MRWRYALVAGLSRLLDVIPYRSDTLTLPVQTSFGKCFIHVQINAQGQPVGGAISHKGKEPNSQIAKLIEDLSAGFNDAMKIGAEW